MSTMILFLALLGFCALVASGVMKLIATSYELAIFKAKAFFAPKRNVKKVDAGLPCVEPEVACMEVKEEMENIPSYIRLHVRVRDTRIAAPKVTMVSADNAEAPFDPRLQARVRTRQEALVATERVKALETQVAGLKARTGTDRQGSSQTSSGRRKSYVKSEKLSVLEKNVSWRRTDPASAGQDIGTDEAVCLPKAQYI